MLSGRRFDPKLDRRPAGSLGPSGGQSRDRAQSRDPDGDRLPGGAVCVAPAALAPVSPVPPTRTPRPAWKQRHRQRAQGADASARGSDTPCGASRCLGDRLRGHALQGPAQARPTASASLACTSHVEN